MQQGAVASIFQTFRAYHIVLSSVGFMPLRVRMQGGIHNRSIHYPVFFTSLFAAALLALCFIGQEEPENQTLLVRYGNYTLHLLFTSMAIFVVLFNYLKRHKIANCLLAMHHFDCMMEVGQMHNTRHFT
jgi:hypothetical protein